MAARTTTPQLIGVSELLRMRKPPRGPVAIYFSESQWRTATRAARAKRLRGPFPRSARAYLVAVRVPGGLIVYPVCRYRTFGRLVAVEGGWTWVCDGLSLGGSLTAPRPCSIGLSNKGGLKCSGSCPQDRKCTTVYQDQSGSEGIRLELLACVCS